MKISAKGRCRRSGACHEFSNPLRGVTGTFYYLPCSEYHASGGIRRFRPLGRKGVRCKQPSLGAAVCCLDFLAGHCSVYLWHGNDNYTDFASYVPCNGPRHGGRESQNRHILLFFSCLVILRTWLIHQPSWHKFNQRFLDVDAKKGEASVRADGCLP